MSTNFYSASLKLDGARADLVVMATERSRALQAGGRRCLGSSRGCLSGEGPLAHDNMSGWTRQEFYCGGRRLVVRI